MVGVHIEVSGKASNICLESHLARPSNPHPRPFHPDSEMASQMNVDDSRWPISPLSELEMDLADFHGVVLILLVLALADIGVSTLTPSTTWTNKIAYIGPKRSVDIRNSSNILQTPRERQSGTFGTIYKFSDAQRLNGWDIRRKNL